jgi:hypothetical protein
MAMQVTRNTHTMHIVNRLKSICEKHDWYFTLADDYRAYEAGLVVADEINYLKNVLVARGYERQAESLIDHYRPVMPTLETMLKPKPTTPPKSYPIEERNILCDWRLNGYPTLKTDSSFVDRLMDLGYSAEDAVNLMAEYEVDYEAWSNS